MKKVLFLLLIASSSLRAQDLSGFYVTNNFDTVICEFSVGRIHSNFYDFSRVMKSVRLRVNDEKRKFKPKDLVSFTITTPDTGSYKFISLKEENRFFHEVINGKISLFRTYSTHAYDGSLVITPVAFKNSRLVYLNVINRKKRISKLLEDNPSLLEEWKATKHNYWTGSWFDTAALEEILEEYNRMAKQ